MTSQKKSALLAFCVTGALLSVEVNAADTANTAVIWSAYPAGTQSMPDAQTLSLLPTSGYVPLRTSGGKCLLVARRGTHIVALELAPLAIGTKVIGWKPRSIDMDTLTSKWGYRAPSNPVTSDMAKSQASAWSNDSVAALAAGAESEAAATVAVNGRTYNKYSHFKPAGADAPVAASDEYFCQ